MGSGVLVPTKSILPAESFAASRELAAAAPETEGGVRCAKACA
jgi:hypothetical protein